MGKQAALLVRDEVKGGQSIHKSRRGVGVGLSPRHGSIPLVPIRRAERCSESKDGSRLRGDPSASTLLPSTIDWILELPPLVRPHFIAANFARIANQLHQHWNDPKACWRYLDRLLADHRSGQSGFPAVIFVELCALKKHYGRLHPEPFPSWSRERVVRRAAGSGNGTFPPAHAQAAAGRTLWELLRSVSRVTTWAMSGEAEARPREAAGFSNSPFAHDIDVSRPAI